MYMMSLFMIILLVISAGLSLIGKHAAQFKEYLAKDHEVHDFSCKYHADINAHNTVHV